MALTSKHLRESFEELLDSSPLSGEDLKQFIRHLFTITRIQHDAQRELLRWLQEYRASKTEEETTSASLVIVLPNPNKLPIIW
jgi:uncharacterized protein YerC